MRAAADHRWVPTVRRALQIIGAIIGLVAAAAMARQFVQARGGEVANAEGQMSQLVMVFAEQTGRAVETVDSLLRGAIDAMGQKGANAPGDGVALEAMLRRQMAGVRQIGEIDIVDAGGAVVLSTRRPGAPAFILPPAGRKLLAAYRDGTTGLRISDPVRDADGDWIALLTRERDDQAGHFAGMGVATLRLSYFENFYQAVHLNDHGAIVLHLRDGTVLARYPHVDGLIGSSFAKLSPFTQILAHADAGTVIMTSPVDGQRRILAIRALRAFPLAVNVSVNESNVLSIWRRQTGIFLVVLVLACATGGTLLLLLAREWGRVEAALGEYREARDEAQSANAKLRVQMAERQRAEAALQQAQRIEAIGQLTGGVAHDFNNLLTVLLGNIDLMQQTGSLDRATTERLDRMRAAAERGAMLTDQLLSFARRQPLVPRAISLNDVADGMLGLLQSAIGGTIRVATVLDQSIWPAMVDPTQIELAVLNLAINARDAMPKGGTVTLETGNVRLPTPASADDAPAGDYVMIRVRDTGTGMTDLVKTRAFEPFFTTKGPGAGSGLGLSQVFGLARQSGGAVRLESELGVGTTIDVLLPRAASEPDVILMPISGFPELTAQSRVLLVDDDEAVRSTTGMILGAMGYCVVQAESGREALELLGEGEAIDLLLTDVAMPGMNGPELVRQVHLMRPVMPVVFFSGYADPEVVAGVAIRQRLVRKPFRAADLGAQIEAALADFRGSAA